MRTSDQMIEQYWVNDVTDRMKSTVTCLCKKYSDVAYTQVLCIQLLSLICLKRM